MTWILRIARVVLYVLGFIEKVRAHTRAAGTINVASYWRHA